MLCGCACVEKVPGGNQHKAGAGDEEWKVHAGHEDMPEVLAIGQRWAPAAELAAVGSSTWWLDVVHWPSAIAACEQAPSCRQDERILGCAC